MQCDNGHDNPAGMAYCGVCGFALPAELTDVPTPPGQKLGEPPQSSGASVAAPGPISMGDENTDGVEQTPPANDVAPKKSKRALVFAAVAVLALVAVGGFFVFGAAQSHPIEEAAESCDVEGNLQDEGSSITFDTEGAEDLSGDDYEDVACVLTGLDAPDRVISQMDRTRALDGTLDASWDDYEASWNYHPDSGMNLTIYEAD